MLGRARRMERNAIGFGNVPNCIIGHWQRVGSVAERSFHRHAFGQGGIGVFFPGKPKQAAMSGLTSSKQSFVNTLIASCGGFYSHVTQGTSSPSADGMGWQGAVGVQLFARVPDGIGAGE